MSFFSRRRGDLGKANKESKSFFGGKTKRGRVSRIFNSDLFPEHKTICIMNKTQWRFSLQPPTLHATFCET